MLNITSRHSQYLALSYVLGVGWIKVLTWEGEIGDGFRWGLKLVVSTLYGLHYFSILGMTIAIWRRRDERKFLHMRISLKFSTNPTYKFSPLRVCGQFISIDLDLKIWGLGSKFQCHIN